MKNVFTSLREHAKNIIEIEKKKNVALTKEELKTHQDPKVCYNCGKIVLKRSVKDKNYREVRDHCHYTGKYRDAAHSICNLKLNVPTKIPVVSQNGSNYIINLSLKN